MSVRGQHNRETGGKIYRMKTRTAVEVEMIKNSATSAAIRAQAAFGKPFSFLYRRCLESLAGNTIKLHNRSRKPLARLKHSLGMIQFPQFTID